MTLPIPTEHLPAVVSALRADGVAYLNVEHVDWPCDHKYYACEDIGCCGPNPPPERWYALADATCDECFPDVWDKATCPDCRGIGKPIHTLTVVTFPNDRGGGISQEGEHRVSVDVVVAELVPVVGESLRFTGRSGIELGDSENNHRSPCTLWAHGQWSPIATPLGPPLTPGDWVAVLRKAAR